MSPDEVDSELVRLVDEYQKKRSIGLLELVTQAFAVGCKYRQGVSERPHSSLESDRDEWKTTCKRLMQRVDAAESRADLELKRSAELIDERDQARAERDTLLTDRHNLCVDLHATSDAHVETLRERDAAHARVTELEAMYQCVHCAGTDALRAALTALADYYRDEAAGLQRMLDRGNTSGGSIDFLTHIESQIGRWQEVETRARAILAGNAPAGAAPRPVRGADGYRICQFCGCHTNAYARACCDAGRDDDKAAVAERRACPHVLLDGSPCALRAGHGTAHTPVLPGTTQADAPPPLVLDSNVAWTADRDALVAKLRCLAAHWMRERDLLSDDSAMRAEHEGRRVTYDYAADRVAKLGTGTETNES